MAEELQATQSETATESAQPTATEAPQTFVDTLDESIRGEPSLKNFNDANTLAKSYLSAQRMIGLDKIAIPNQNSTQEEWNAAYNSLGRPSTPEEYGLNYSSENENDIAQVKEFGNVAHTLGLNANQAKGILDFYSNMQNQSVESLSANQEILKQQTETELRKEFGMAYDQKINKASQAARTFANEEIFNLPLQDGRLLGDHPEIVKAFVKIAESMSEDNLVGETQGALTPNEAQKEIGELMKEGSPYWNAAHPDHKKFVNDVFALRQMVTPEA